jgi:hypothetical protein
MTIVGVQDHASKRIAIEQGENLVAGGQALKTDDEELRYLLMKGLWKGRCCERRFGGEEGAASTQ